MANPHPTPRVVRQQRLEPLQGLDIQVMGQLIADQPAGDLVAGEVVAGQAGAHPGTLVTRSTFPELYPVLAPERPPDGKPAPTSKLVTRSTFPMLYPVLAPERPPDGKPAPTSKLVTRSTFPMLYPVLAPERPPDGKPANSVRLDSCYRQRFIVVDLRAGCQYWQRTAKLTVGLEGLRK